MRFAKPITFAKCNRPISPRYALSLNWLFDANRVTLRHALAIPFRAETCGLMKVRKPHDHESEKANHDEDEQNSQYVGTRRVPLRPSHLSIHKHSGSYGGSGWYAVSFRSSLY